MSVAMFLVHVVRSGPAFDQSRPLAEQTEWKAHAEFMNGLVDEGFVVLGGPVDEYRVAHAVEAESEEEIRETLARDPWSQSHVVVAKIEPWTILLDARQS